MEHFVHDQNVICCSIQALWNIQHFSREPTIVLFASYSFINIHGKILVINLLYIETLGKWFTVW